MKEVRFSPTHTRKDGLELSNIPIPEGFKVVDYSLVSIPAGSMGGNHKHPRTEVFVTMDPLTLYWLDENNEVQETSMGPVNGQYKLFTAPPFLPHAVINETGEKALLVEFSDQASDPKDVVKVEVVRGY